MNIAQRTRHLPRSPASPDDIDGCPTVYACEEICQCMDEALLDVDLDARGAVLCTNCQRRRV